jgi:hypothetical protein
VQRALADARPGVVQRWQRGGDDRCVLLLQQVPKARQQVHQDVQPVAHNVRVGLWVGGWVVTQ